MKILFMFVFFSGQDHVIGSRLRHILLIEKSVQIAKFSGDYFAKQPLKFKH
jgi:hypothetical protein